MLNESHEALLAPLRRRAAMLNQIDTPAAGAKPVYDRGAIVWTDELLPGVSAEVLWGLDPLWGYRTSLIKGEPHDFWRPYWEACMALFPHWIGFRPERRLSSPETVRVIQEELQRLMAEMDARDQNV